MKFQAVPDGLAHLVASLSFWSDTIANAVGGLVGAFVGAGAAVLFALWQRKSQDRQLLTQRLIDEFVSTGFLHHQIGGGGVRRQIADGKISISDVAAGFWHPGLQDYFTGDMSDGLNQHQHIEALIRWVRRAASAVRAGQVQILHFRASLKESYRWLDDLLTPLAIEVRRQVKAAQRIDDRVHVPSWTQDVDTLRKAFSLELTTALPHKFTREELQSVHSVSGS